MTVTEVQQETGWGKRGDTWVPPTPVPTHGHGRDDLDGIWDPGDIKWSARINAAPGWLKCDGSLKPINQHRRLFEAIGFAYSPVPGTDPGGGNFHLPPPGCMPVGLDPAQVEFDTLGERGGSKTTTAPHTHALEGHTHTFSTNAVSVDHAHNVYTRNMGTAWQSDTNGNWSHWHGARIGNVGYNYALDHGHHDRGGYAAEAPWEDYRAPGASIPVNVDSTDTNHYHNANHDHPSTNYATQSPWAGNTGSHSHSGTTAGAGGLTGAGASSAAVTSGNLPPYVVFNCFIKT